MSLTFRPEWPHAGGAFSVAVGQLDAFDRIVSGADGTVRVWDPTSGEQTNELTGHTSEVWSVAIGQLVGRDRTVSGGADGTVRVWDPTSGEQTSELDTISRCELQKARPKGFEGPIRETA